MSTPPANIAAFLDSSSIAVVGVSRDKHQPANTIFQRLRETGHTAVPVNPHMKEFGGGTCYSDLTSIPNRPEAVFIATNPIVSPGIVKECAELGIAKVWFHRSIGDGSWSEEAAEECRKHGIEAIEGGCPMMFVGRVDIFHRCLRWFCQRSGKN